MAWWAYIWNLIAWIAPYVPYFIIWVALFLWSLAAVKRDTTQTRRPIIEVAVTVATATLPIWLGGIIIPGLPASQSQNHVGVFDAVKHGELFVAATALLAPILSTVMRGAWPESVRRLPVNVTSFFVLLVSVGFFFALISDRPSYASPYVVIWSVAIFALAVAAFYAHTAQTAPTDVQSPAIAEAEQLKALDLGLDVLRKSEDNNQ